MSAGGYSFPLLSVKEIVQALLGLDVNVTEQALLQPSGGAIFDVYEQCVFQLALPREEIRALPFAALSAAHADADNGGAALHERVTVLHLICRLMRAVGVADFAPAADLTAPAPARVRRVLSAVVNYAKFREECLASYDDAMTAVKQLQDERARLETEAAAARAARARAEAVREAEAPARAQLQRDTDALQRQVGELRTRSEGVAAEALALKAQLKDAVQGLRAAADAHKQRAAEYAVLQAQIVSSPEALTAEIAALQLGNARAERELAALEEDCADKAARETALRELARRVERLAHLARACGDELARVHEQDARAQECARRLADCERAAEDAKRGIDRAARDGDALEQTRFHAEGAHDKRRAALEAHAHELAAVRDRLQRRAEEDAAIARETAARCTQVREAAAAAAREHEELKAAGLARYQQCVASIDKYQQRVAAAMRAHDVTALVDSV